MKMLGLFVLDARGSFHMSNRKAESLPVVERQILFLLQWLYYSCT